ncbi:MAG: hypothetical protein ACLFVB_10605, partial [Thermoplasmata archaeon]
SSTDDTPEKIQKIKDEYDLNIKHIQKETDILTALQIGLEESSCRWILKWEGDAVAYDRIHKIKDIIDSLDDKKYYVMYPPLLQMRGFFDISGNPLPLNIEQRMFKYSPWVEYVLDPERNADKLELPIFYEKIPIKFICVMHLIGAKSPGRKLFKRYRNEWVIADQSEYESYEKFVDHQLKKEYGTTDKDEILKDIRKKYEQKVKSPDTPVYDKGIFGDYPKPLKKFLREKYNIDVNKGKIREIKDEYDIFR